MKKTLFTLIATIATLAAAAQDTAHYQSLFGNLSSSWHVARFIHSNGRGGAHTAVLSYTADSTLYASGWHPILAGPDTVLSLRESPDHSRLFLRYHGDSSALLLMDLNLLPGDTLRIPFADGSDTLAIADSVYLSGGLKHIRTSLALPFSPYVGIDSSATSHGLDLPVPLTLIEGVGPNWGLDFTRQCLDSLLAVSPLLLCHFRDSARTYHQTVDSDYPRPDGSPNDPCSVEYIRYKSTIVPGTEWYETHSRGYHGDGTRGLIIDTTLVSVYSDSIKYNRVIYNALSLDDLQSTCSFHTFVNFLRESKDRSKVYGIYNHKNEYYDNDDLSQECLLMDLSLNVGDTFFFNPTCCRSHLRQPPDYPAFAIVDSVYSQDGLKHIRFEYFLGSENEQREIREEDLGRYYKRHVPFEFIENIGITWGYSHMLRETIVVMSRLSCVFRNGELIYSPCINPIDPAVYPYYYNCCVECTFGGGIDNTDTRFMNIHPNPASDFLTINNLPQTPSTITIQDTYGRTWMTLAHTGESITLDLSHLPPQVYLVSIIQEDYMLTKRIVKL